MALCSMCVYARAGPHSSGSGSEGLVYSGPLTKPYGRDNDTNVANIYSMEAFIYIYIYTHTHIYMHIVTISSSPSAHTFRWVVQQAY